MYLHNVPSGVSQGALEVAVYRAIKRPTPSCRPGWCADAGDRVQDRVHTGHPAVRGVYRLPAAVQVRLHPLAGSLPGHRRQDRSDGSPAAAWTFKFLSQTRSMR